MADIGRELGWDDTIEKDPEFSLLPAGEYNFEVISFERGRHNGSEKLPPCNKAILKVRFEAPDGSAASTFDCNLFLHSTQEGKLCSFFTAIGQRKHGEKLQMNWNKVVGATGRAKIKIRDWNDKDGNKQQSNDVQRWLEPDEAPAAPSYETGKF
jgi:hypothetical protein